MKEETEARSVSSQACFSDSSHSRMDQRSGRLCKMKNDDLFLNPFVHSACGSGLLRSWISQM